MSEKNYTVMLSDKVWRQIDWFTRHLDTEIGAIGSVKIKQYEDGEKYFYVYELMFPQQTVTGATIHVDKDTGFNKIIAKKHLKGLKNVSFYWHRHPGSASHSGTDEEESFNTLMKENKDYFIFYQTAITSSGKWDEEVRIEIKNNVLDGKFIIDKNIDVISESTPEEKALETECKKIVEECVIKEEHKNFSSKKPYLMNFDKSSNSTSAYGDVINLDKDDDLIETAKDAVEKTEELTDKIKESKLGDVSYYYLNNSEIVKNKENLVSINFEFGTTKITCGKDFAHFLTKYLADTNGALSKSITSYSRKDEDESKVVFFLIPKTFSDLRYNLMNIYLDFMKKIFSIEDGEDEDDSDTFGEFDVSFKDKKGRLIKKVEEALKNSFYNTIWEDDEIAYIYDIDSNAIGQIDKDEKIINIYSSETVINIVKNTIGLK